MTDHVDAGRMDRLHIIPIIKDNTDRTVYFGDPQRPAAMMTPPDQVVGYRFYVEKDGHRQIFEVRCDKTSDYNLVSVYYRDWTEADVARQSIDSVEDQP